MGNMELPTDLKDYFFKKWELRDCVLLSLFLQIFLIFAGTFRRSSHTWIVILLWLAYLLADVVAVFGLGLVVSGQSLYSIYCDDDPLVCYQDHLHIYWAPFLLVHLGGPDFITSFAPEDNELWRRHLFYLASQCIAVAYCFYQSQQFSNQLRIPTILMLLCGILKCSERICALYYGSANSFRSSHLSVSDINYTFSKQRTKLLTRMNGDTLSHLQVLQYAFEYFLIFKGLVVDLRLGIHERNQSREFFLATSNKDALRLVEVELNYIYDVLFTKLPVLHHKLAYCSRTLYFISAVVSLALFHSELNRKAIFSLDKVITYILLVGAIALDMIQFLMLLFCDWAVIKLRPPFDANAEHKSWKHKFVDWILLFVKNTKNLFLDWLFGIVRARDHHCTSKFTNHRWADSLSTFNLINYCLHRSEEREKICSYFGIVSLVTEIWFVKSQPLTDYMTCFVFNELKMKSQVADSLAMAKQICSSKGEWILQQIEGLNTFLPFVVDYNYDEILLMWHIATEVCYNDLQDELTNNLEQRETAKKLSDYMLYLMVMKTDMMYVVSTTGEIKFRDTCIEVSKLFDTKLSELKKKTCCFFGRGIKKEREALLIKACETILSVNSEFIPFHVQSDRYAFLLYNASVLAKELKLLPSEKKWLTISKLWVELLSYAAIRIRPSAHLKLLNNGGELMTIVWLLMAHFGLGDQYEISPGNQETEGDS